MVHLAAVDESVLRPIEHAAALRVPEHGSLERTATIWCDEVYAALGRALVLVRIFAIVPFESLPAREREFAVRRAGANELTKRSPVVVLMGSRGEVESWSVRTSSRGHLATPLGTPALAESAPMISGLFDDGERGANGIGQFYVVDAQTTLDAQRRHVVPDRGFVDRHDVRTVFGLSGRYESGARFAFIHFARQHLSRSVADAFVPLVSAFQASTEALVGDGRLFDPSP